MSETLTTTDKVKVATPDPLKPYLVGTGALGEAEVAQALADVKRWQEAEAAGAADERTAGEAFTAAEAAMREARKAQRMAAIRTSESHTLVVRTMFIIGTPLVRGAVSMSPKRLAEALGVTPGYVSQTIGKSSPIATYWAATGSTAISPDVLRKLEDLYRKDRAALAQYPAQVRQAAIERTSETSGQAPASSAAVKATSIDARKALTVQAQDAAVAAVPQVKVANVVRYLDNVRDSLKVKGADSDLAPLREAVRRLTATLDSLS